VIRRLLRRGRAELPYPTPRRALSEDRALLGQADPEDRQIVERALPHTMTGIPRMLALIDAVRYCVNRPIPGAFAECGVWRGGSVLAMILTLQAVGAEPRDIHLYDTFEGMTAPTEEDVSDIEGAALEVWDQAERENRRAWTEVFDAETFNEEAVRHLLLSTGYPSDRLHFVRGPVEETLPASVPKDLALLRLDTDWYASTRHELTHLFPLLRPGGVLIVDDYGHWRGARQAIDEYFSSAHPPLLFSRIDYTGRIAVRT
jgi:O-methyltransferase